MKLIITLMALIHSGFAIADTGSPEDRIRPTCFQAVEAVPAKVPALLCLETFAYYGGDQLFITGGNLEGDYKITHNSRHNEDRLNIKAQKNLFNDWESICGDGDSAEIVIAATEYYGNIDIQALDISVEYSHTNDTCHSIPQDTTIKYQFVR